MLTLMNRDSWFPMFNEFFDDFAPGASLAAPYQLDETEDHYLIEMDVPGVPKDRIQLELKDGILRVSAERRDRKWTRAFTLPRGVDAERIEASVEDGVLRIAVPKAETAKARTIRIQEGRPGLFQKLLSGAKKEGPVEKSA